jgi:probable HAF family extracellular repeat protein
MVPGASPSSQAHWAIVDLGRLSGPHQAVEINDSGQIVFTAAPRASNDMWVGHAFLWEKGKVHDLGTLGGENSGAGAINTRGEIVGWSSTAGRSAHAFLWAKGRLTDLGVLGAGEAGDSEASAINETGQIVGSSSTGAGYHPVLWQGGKRTDLGTLGILDAGSEIWPKASDLNERGQVVGTSATRGRSPRAYLWQNGRMHNLGTLGGATWARAINDRGLIVGGSYTVPGAYGSQHAFSWEKGTMHDLGTLGGKSSDAIAVNNSGQIVGWSRVASGAVHAFLWQKGRMTDLGTLGASGSVAVAINERGQALVNRFANTCSNLDPGYTSLVGEPLGYLCFGVASVWENGELTDLGSLPGAGTSRATGLNERGQIVGTSSTETGPDHAVLWTLRP